MRLILALAVCAAVACAQPPEYAAEGVVHSATGQATDLAPNTIATLYGKLLSYETVLIGVDQIRDGTLPTMLPRGGLRVLLNGMPAPLYYVSPAQVNFLVPAEYRAGRVTLQLLRDSLAGPKLTLTLAPTSPGLFQAGANYAVAVHLDGSVLTAPNPGKPGEVIVLFATGLGDVFRIPTLGELAPGPSKVAAGVDVLLNGAAVPPQDVLYAGLSPGFAGLYQINLRLPQELPAEDPEVQVIAGGRASRAGLRLAARAMLVE